jgi:hypothetical protein
LTLFLHFDVEQFSLSDDDKPKKDVVAVPPLGTPTTPEGHSQEEAVVVTPSPVLHKKNPTTPPSKRQKRAAAVAASLEVHQPSAPSDNMSIAACVRLCFILEFLRLSYNSCSAAFDAEVSFTWC